jgi:hypothetical protein
MDDVTAATSAKSVDYGDKAPSFGAGPAASLSLII